MQLRHYKHFFSFQQVVYILPRLAISRNHTVLSVFPGYARVCVAGGGLSRNWFGYGGCDCGDVGIFGWKRDGSSSGGGDDRGSYKSRNC